MTDEFEYSYEKTVNAARIMHEVSISESISTPLVWARQEGADIKLTFEAMLTNAEGEALSALVTAHVATPLVKYEEAEEKILKQSVISSVSSEVYSPPPGKMAVITSMELLNTTVNKRCCYASIFHDDNGSTYNNTTQLGFNQYLYFVGSPVFRDTFIPLNSANSSLAMSTQTFADTAVVTIIGKEYDISDKDLKQLGQVKLTTTGMTDLYVPPAGKTGIVKSIFMTRISKVSTPLIDIHVSNSGAAVGSANKVMNSGPVYSMIVMNNLQWRLDNVSAYVKARSTQADAHVLTLYGEEF